MATQAPSTQQAPTTVQATKTGDLSDELSKALNASKSQASGSFYHCCTAANAPNPGLSIDGVGNIGLPLSQHDAAGIISRAAQAPFGKGTETVVDTTVRDTWEIEPGLVKFSNPHWAAFVEEVATKQVWTALGVAPFTTRPRCELYKLLLYQPGGHFLAHQDTLKSDGMFATIIIVLPSPFLGGEVHVSHAGETKVLDVSQSSRLRTSILAWYTDVLHEVKSVTAGYRLALSYNLIHTSPNMPQPSLPKGDMLSTPLGLCLQKWKNEGFATMPNAPLTTYLLDHEYSTDDLDDGQEGLKGKDAQMAAQLMPLAESLGFVVGLANISRHVTGSADDSGYRQPRYNKRMKYGRPVYDEHESDDGETHTFADIEEDEYEIEHFVRIDSGAGGDEDLDLGDFVPDKSCFVPRDMFKGVAPEREEYEGYMGNYAGALEQWYHRSVLILFRSEDTMSVGISINGVDWALDQLDAFESFENQDDPTAKLLVSALLVKIERKAHLRRSYGEQKEVEAERRCAKRLLACALGWKKQELWCRVVPRCGPALDTANTSVVAEALAVFDLDSIKPGLASLAKQSPALQTRFAVINAIADKLGAAGNEWTESVTQHALSSYRAAAVADIPTLIGIAGTRGAEVIETCILPRVPKAKTYDFLVALSRALHELRLTQPGEKKTALTRAIHQCVAAASRQWQEGTDRLTQLADLCFSLGEPALCSTVLGLVRKNAPYSVLVAFVKTLHKNLSSISGVADDTRVAISNVIRAAMQSAILKWEVGLRITAPQVTAPPQPSPYNRPSYGRGTRPSPPIPNVDPRAPNVKTDRICELAELIFSLGDPSIFTTLFNVILQLPTGANMATRFKNIYTPLMPQLKATLGKHATAVTTEPFASFFKNVIGLYLAHILGPHTPATPLPTLPVRNIGCNACVECEQLQAFANNGAPELKFRAVQKIRTHIETQIANANISDRVRTQTITNEGTPYTLVVSKHPEVIAQLTWTATQGEAISFLRSVADDVELRHVMGERYEQVLWAIHGHQVFFIVGSAPSAIHDTPAGAVPHTAPSACHSSTPVPTASNSMTDSSDPPTSAKRKHRETQTNTIAVIDLT